ncbi:MAG: hypothetical protein Q4A83_03965 [Bacillota bacterium]|nr:hypothetical protein [Bacillota bacterium]
MKKQAVFAEIIRRISQPPVLTAIVLFTLYYSDSGIFSSAYELVLAIVCLAIVPALSYPICRLRPQILKSGHNTRRQLEIILSLTGCAAIWLIGFAEDFGNKLMLILTVYFFTFVLLAAANELLHVGTSSYACCVTVPIIVSGFFFGAASIAICLLLYMAIVWASVYTERHTKAEYVLGLAVCAAACLPSGLLYLMA